MLLGNGGEGGDSEPHDDDDRNISFDERVKRNKRRRLNRQEKYRKCEFILGSVAEVERLWSIAKNVRTVNRRRMTPILFESILFLKVNHRYWDQVLVSASMAYVRNRNVEERLEQDD